jgi:hypothetical protein
LPWTKVSGSRSVKAAELSVQGLLLQLLNKSISGDGLSSGHPRVSL